MEFHIFSFFKGSNGSYIDSAGAATLANNDLIFRTGGTVSNYGVSERVRITSAGQITLSKLNTIREDVINDVEFYHNEDLVNEEYQYSIKYKDPKKSQYNLSQTINEKKSQLKSWQGSYTVISEYIRNNAETLNDKKDLAYNIKDKLAEWHLCDIDILNRIKNNISTIENNQIDLDINQAIQYACGFTG